jgi:hypothetical protein
MESLIVFVLGIILIVINAFIVMIAWNAVIPDIFALHAIGFWQALLLTVLSNALVGRGVRASGYTSK